MHQLPIFLNLTGRTVVLVGQGEAADAKARLIVRIGNQAVHEARETRAAEAANAVRELFHLCFWLARTYARQARPDDGLRTEPWCAIAHLRISKFQT